MNLPSFFANKLIKQFDLEGKFNMDELVFLIGGRIIYTPSLEVDAIIKKELNKFVIFVNNSKPISRQRFSIAHELGHLFIHLRYGDNDFWQTIDDDASIMQRYGSSVEEREANQFAAELLMPSEQFTKIANDNLSNNTYQLDPIANYFGTSIDSVIYRGVNLNLWKN